MTKGDRKRANNSPRTEATKAINRDDAMPLQQNEAYLVQNWIDQSNVYGKLVKQFEQYEFNLQNMLWKRKQIQKGDIKVDKDNPVLIPLVGQAMCQITEKKQVLKDLDDQIKTLTISRYGIKGQMIHRRDEYVEAALRLLSFLKERYGKYTTKKIDDSTGIGTGVRVKAGKAETQKKQETIFEAELEEILKDAEKQAEFKEKAKEAAEHNKKLKKE